MNSTDGAPTNVTFDLASTDGDPHNATFNLHSKHTDRQTVASLYTAAYVINSLLGLPTNSYVLWLIVTGVGGGVAAEIFTLNLSVSEIINCLSAVLYLLYRYGFPAVKDPYRFFNFLLLIGRPLFQCCVCVERYLAVLRPVVFLKCRPLRYRVALSAAAWVVVLAFSLVLMFIPRRSIYYFILALYLVVLSVQSFCCLAVIRALKRSGPGDRGREREEGENRMKERAFRIILIFLVSMVIGYTPMTMVSLMSSLISHVQRAVFKLVGNCTILALGFVQPLLYLHRAGKLPFVRAT